MKSPRRSTRSTKSHSLFSFSQWKLEDEYWTSESKRLRKAAKKTSTQDITAKPIDGRTEIQDLNKQEIGGADYISDKEGRSLLISGVRSVGYPSSTASHSITEKSRSADGNCVNERNVIKEKTQLKVIWIAESTDMIVDRKKEGGNGNIVKLKKARKNKTDIVVNPNMKTYKKMKCQNEDSNVINSEPDYKDDNSFEGILNQADICPSLEGKKLKQRQEAFEGENVTEQTKRQCVPVASQDSSGNSSEVNNASLTPSTQDTCYLSNESEMKNDGCGQINKEKDNPEFSLTPMILIKAEVETESGESEMRCRAGNMVIISHVPSAIPSFPNDMKNSSSAIISDIPSFEPYSTDDVSFQPRQNVTVDRPRPSVIMETPRGIIGTGWPHDRDSIGMETPRDTISRGWPHGRDSIGMETPRGIISSGWPHDRDTIGMETPRDIISRDGPHGRDSIGMDASQHITEVGSASGRVDTPTMYLTTESAEAREAVSSREGAQLVVARERGNRAGLEVVGPSAGVVDQVVGGAIDGSRSEGVNHSVDNSAQEAVGGAIGSRLEVVKYSVVTQIKIKMEIELSTAQFIEVAHVLPALGSSTNFLVKM